jgi:hypothetical protein
MRPRRVRIAANGVSTPPSPIDATASIGRLRSAARSRAQRQAAEITPFSDRYRLETALLGGPARAR